VLFFISFIISTTSICVEAKDFNHSSKAENHCIIMSGFAAAGFLPVLAGFLVVITNQINN